MQMIYIEDLLLLVVSQIKLLKSFGCLRVEMKPDLARIRLREAAVARDLVLLRQAIEDCRSYPMGGHEDEIQEAEALLIRLEHRQGNHRHY